VDEIKGNIDRVRWQNAVDKYLSYLSLLYQINPQIAKSAFNRVGTARKRILFSESKSSIVGSLRDGSYSETSVQKIGNSPFYAFVGLDNRSKSKFLDEVMQICTVPVSLRSEVLASFN